MSHYYTLGNIPHKRHTQFRKPDGGLYSEQLFSTEGFSDDYSLLYHCHPPTQIIKTEPQVDVSPIIAEEKMLKHRCFEGFDVKPGGEYLQSRVPVLVNKDCHIVLAAPQTGTKDYFYKNTDADEMIFIHEGSGTVKTQYGELPFGTVIILFYHEEPYIKLNFRMRRIVCSLLNRLLLCVFPNVT
jgi:homogentisate 1,2-dioxygenase